MIALISFLVIIILSIIVVKVGGLALEMTGLSSEIAVFEAQSAFSGVGFTTSESESIIYHPVRRRIIRVLMLMGSAGLTSAIATLVLTFVGQSRDVAMVRLGGIAIGLFFLYLIVRSKWADRIIVDFFKRFLQKHTTLKLYDYEKLFHLTRGFAISKFKAKEGSWLTGHTLRELKLHQEGILFMGISRQVNDKEEFIGAPRGDTRIKTGDTIIVYGTGEAIKSLATRIKGTEGDIEHQKAVKKAKKIWNLKGLKRFKWGRR